MTKIAELMKKNPFDILSPYNLWFVDKRYEVEYYEHNNQILRLRKWKNKILNFTRDNYGQILGYPFDAPLYQPNYPEKFYSFWELCKKFPEIVELDDSLFIGKEYTLGNYESFIINRELNGYFDNEYDYAISEEINVIDNDLIFKTGYDLLGQSFQTRRLKKISNKYELIIIDVLNKWTTDSENDQLVNDFNNMKILYGHIIKKLDKNGSMIVRLNQSYAKKWKNLLNKMTEGFKKCNVFCPVSSHPDYDECYLVLKNFIGSDNKKKISVIDLFKNINKTNIDIDMWFKEMKIVRISNVENNKLTVPFKMRLSRKTETYRNMNNLKIELNHMKRVMDTKASNIFMDSSNYTNISKCKLFKWDNFMKLVDPFGDTRQLLKSRNDISESNYITNAWLKLYEILEEFVYFETKKIKSFHLCEAPGAFIKATEYYCKKNKIKLTWVAQTLNSEKDSNALTDHFGIINKYSDRWDFGNKNTGDITDPEIIKYYSKKYKNMDFITADGGIYCTPKLLNYQDTLLCKLVLGEIITVLECLKIGGTAVVKVFIPMIDPFYKSIMKILYECFDKIFYYKPSHSTPVNSEFYLVMINYYKKYNDIKNLYKLLNSKNIHETKIINNFNSTNHNEIVSILMNNQINSLKSAYKLYYTSEDFNKESDDRLSKKWIRKYIDN